MGWGERVKNKTFHWGVVGCLIPPQGCAEGSVTAAGASRVAMSLSPPSPPPLPFPRPKADVEGLGGGAALGRLFLLKHDRFGGDGWVKLANDQQLKAYATVTGEQMESAWEGAMLVVLAGAMVGSREVLERAKLVPGVLVGAQLWLPLPKL